MLLSELELPVRKTQSEKGRAMLRDGISKLRSDPASDRWTQSLLRIEAVETLARDLGDWIIAADVARQMQQSAPGYAGTDYAPAKEADHAGHAAAARQEYQAAISGWNAADADFAPLTDARHPLAALPNPH